MPKRPDSIETTVLAIELLRRIPRGRKISAAELHDQLASVGIERDIRTIQRQLEMLSEHFEIERDDRTKPYGYRWLENSKGLVLTNLTSQESLLLSLASEHLSNILPGNIQKSMKSFFEQAQRNLSAEGSANLAQQWKKKVRVVSTSQPLLPPKIATGVLESVSEALYHNQWLHLNYRNATHKESAVEVMPLGLAQQGPCMYLVCRYRGYENERSLALHRILSAKASTITFDRPKDFDLQKYDTDGRFGFGEGKRVSLTFKIDKKVGYFLLETPLSKDQTITEVGEWLEINATLVDSAMLRWWLQGFGEKVTDINKIPATDQ